jgi:hypothetical protein
MPLQATRARKARKMTSKLIRMESKHKEPKATRASLKQTE